MWNTTRPMKKSRTNYGFISYIHKNQKDKTSKKKYSCVYFLDYNFNSKLSSSEEEEDEQEIPEIGLSNVVVLIDVEA